MMDFEKLFDDFSNKIKDCNHLLTEDGMRYYFFACMLLQDPNLDHYILELPYKKMATAGIIADINCLDTGIHKQLELDMFYDGDISCCFEFKFHRTGDLESTFAQPDAAGSLFNDLNRLQLIKSYDNKEIKKFFIYLTDSTMHEYLANPQNRYSKQLFRQGIKEFYLLTPELVYSSISIKVGKKNKTFRNSAYKSFRDKDKDYVTINNIKMRYSIDIDVNKRCKSFADSKGYIRIYEIN